jgi:hypothetical protein
MEKSTLFNQAGSELIRHSRVVSALPRARIPMQSSTPDRRPLILRYLIVADPSSEFHRRHSIQPPPDRYSEAPRVREEGLRKKELTFGSSSRRS